MISPAPTLYITSGADIPKTHTTPRADAGLPFNRPQANQAKHLIPVLNESQCAARTGCAERRGGDQSQNEHRTKNRLQRSILPVHEMV